MKEKFSLFGASLENETQAPEVEAPTEEVSQLDENELVANDVVESTGGELTEVSGDGEALDMMETDIEGLQKDVEIAEAAIAETGVVPEATVESIRMRIKKAQTVYHVKCDSTSRHFAKENYTSIAVSKNLSVDAVKGAEAALEGMISGFFKSIGIAFARTFKVLENIEKASSEIRNELKDIKGKVSEASGGLFAGTASSDLSKGNVWQGDKIDANGFGQLINRNAKATNSVNDSQSGLLEVIKGVQVLAAEKNQGENTEQRAKEFRNKLSKLTNKSLGTEKEPLAGGVYVELLAMREDIHYDKAITVGKTSVKGKAEIESADGKTLVRMIDTVTNLLESTEELYKEFLQNFKNSKDFNWMSVSNKGKSDMGYLGDGKEKRNTYNTDVIKTIVNNYAKFCINYMNKAVGNVGQSNLRLGKMLIAYANASLKAKPAEAEPEA